MKHIILILILSLSLEASATDIKRFAVHAGVSAGASFLVNKAFHRLLGGGDDIRTESHTAATIGVCTAANAMELGEAAERRAPVQRHALIGNTIGCIIGGYASFRIRF